MDEEKSEQNFNNLCLKPNHSNYKEYDNTCCVQSTAPKSAFCDNAIEYSTKSEDSIRAPSKSDGHFSKNRITPEQSSIPISSHCSTVNVKIEKR